MARGAALAAVDVVLGSRGPLAAPVQAMLLGGAGGGAAPSLAAAGVRLELTVTCPRVGARLFVGARWTALTPAGPERPFEHLEAAVHGVRFKLAPDGTALVQRVPCGHVVDGIGETGKGFG